MGHYLICVCLFKHAASFQLCSVLSLLCICYLHQESYIWCVLGICYLLIFCFLYFSTFCCTFEPELLSKVLFIQSSICPWVHLLLSIHYSSVVKRPLSQLEHPSSIPASDTHHSLRALTVSIATGTSNGSCSDALTLQISDWLFHSEGGASCD